MKMTVMKSNLWRRRGLAVAVVALAVVGGPGVTTGLPSASAADNGQVGIMPAAAADFVNLDVFPGNTATAGAVITNRTAKSVTLSVYPVDAMTTPQGAFALNNQTDPRRTVGAWLRLPMATVTVPPGGQVPVQLQLVVPAGTAPGDYAGGVIVQTAPQPGKTVNVSTTIAVQLNVVQRVGLRVYVHVAGTAAPALTLGPLHTRHTANGLEFYAQVTNTGNITLHPSANVTVSGWPGGSRLLPTAEPQVLMPGAQETVAVTWTDPPSWFWGKVHLSVSSEAGTRSVSGPLRRIPPTQATTILIGSVLLLWLAIRLTRFMIRARRALRQVPPAVAATSGRHSRT